MFAKQLYKLLPRLSNMNLGTQSRCFAVEAKTVKEPATRDNTTPMEKTINQVTLLGRVGNEPQKGGSSEHPVVYFSMATHSVYKYETGEYMQKTDWHRICVFKPALRDLVFNYLRKGQRIHISGRLMYGSIKEDSNYKPTVSIVADDIIFFHSLDL